VRPRIQSPAQKSKKEKEKGYKSEKEKQLALFIAKDKI
jgi:hypothetical protein